ncbi:AsmA family protein [Neorhizobium lilium]|uniref:AsmA family protein n=1 Tax=Neorhizobium lilium TaxID=2503024 RepID=A0A444LHF0_9HYPH|nr:AsmA family protein [Neorhizobium lilium]RWX78451.1 AsmA family protein [Neorhizobium lilium]
MFGRIMLALGGLVVLALFTALLAPFFVNWSSFRVGFEEQASRMLGKKVSVHGTVDARILPFPSVTLHDVRIGQDVDGEPLMEVARFSMDMELAPFLSGEARIFDMRIEEPKARLRILKDGTLAWMRGSRAALPADAVVIEDVHVTGGQIDLIDEQSGQTRHITGLSADLSAKSLRGPWQGEGNAILDGYEAKFNLLSGEADPVAQKVPLRLRITPDFQPLEVEFDGVLATVDNKPTYNGGFNLRLTDEETENEPVSAPPPGPRVKGGFELTNERIRIPQYRLEVGATDNPYVVTGEATLDTGLKPEFLLTADGQQIDVNRLGDGPQAKTGRDPAASAQRRINAFLKMAASIPIPQVPGRASLKLPAIVINDTTIRDIRLDVRPAGRGWTVDNGVATLPGRTQLEAKGALNLRDRVSFVGDMLVASSQPSGLSDWLSGRVDPAIRQLRSAGFSAKVNLTPQLQRFENLELAIGAATLKGRVERQSPPNQMPNLSLMLAGNEIDIDAMRALGSLLTGDDAGQDVLDHRIAASLKADRFTALGVAATKVDTAFTIAEGVLSLERLNIGNIEGAGVSAKGRVEGSLLSYAGSGTVALKSADPSAFLAMLRDRLPQHPLLDQLARNGSWYANSDLSADIAVGGALGGVNIKVKGMSNGSSVATEMTLPGVFDLTGGDAFTLNATLSNPEATVLLGQAGLDPLPFGGDGPGTLSLAVKQGETGPAATTLSFKTPKTSAEVKGAVNLQNEGFGEGQGHVSLNSADFEPYLLAMGMGLPQFGSGLPAKVEGDVKLSLERVDVTAVTGNMADNGFSGAFSIDRKAPGLPATGSLQADALDLPWLAEAVYGPLTDAATDEFSAKPFARPIFGGADVSLDVKAGSLHAGALGTAKDFKGKVTYRGGGMTIDDASGEWFGGKLGGRLMMSNGEGAGILQLRLSAENADLGPLVWASGGKPVATGRMSFGLSAESTGKTLSELLHAASGSGELRLKDLGIDGLNAEALKPLMAAADKLQGEITEERVRPLVPPLIHAGHTQVGNVVVPFTITGGEARAQNVTAASGATKLLGEGRLDLLDDEINAELGLTFDPGDEAIVGGDPTIRLNYSGSLDAPKEAVDVSAVSSFLSQRAFEQERRRVETLQASVLEKQRLRREVALYTFRAGERQAAREKAENEARQRRDAEAAAMAAAAAKAQADRQRQSTSPPPFVISPTPDVFRTPDALPAPGGSSLSPGSNFPGVQP